MYVLLIVVQLIWDAPLDVHGINHRGIKNSVTRKMLEKEVLQ